MINKKSLWFLTLFSLILVLSVYYITMPSELMLTQNSSSEKTDKNSKKSNESNDDKVAIEQTSTLTAMRVESDNAMNDELNSLQVVLNDEKSTVEEKNEAYEKIKKINNNRAEEETLEKKIKKDFNLEAYIKIENNNIKVIINSNEHDTSLANKIMRSIQSNYDTNKYITVQFQK